MTAQCVTSWREKQGVAVALRRGTLCSEWGTHLSSLLISSEIRVVVLKNVFNQNFDCMQFLSNATEDGERKAILTNESY